MTSVPMVNRQKITSSVEGNKMNVRNGRKPPPPRLQFEWVEAVTDEQWIIYREAIHALRAAGIRFLLGGGFALATYIGRWRNTKDIDFYIKHDDREKAVEALTKAGFED